MSNDGPFNPIVATELEGAGADIKPVKCKEDVAAVAAAFDHSPLPRQSLIVCLLTSASETMSPREKKKALLDMANKKLDMHPITEMRWFSAIFDTIVGRLYKRGNYKKVSKASTSLIEEIRQHYHQISSSSSSFSSSKEEARPWLVSFILAHSFLVLALSHRQLGGAGKRTTTDRNQDDYELVIQYATQSLYYFRSIQEWAAAQQDDDHATIQEDDDNDDCSSYKREVAILFWIRAQTLRRFDLEKSLLDWKAVMAVIRSVPPEVWEDGPKELRHSVQIFTKRSRSDSLEDARKHLQLIMAMQKVKAKAPRPHYNETEQEMIAKDLGLGVYSQGLYRCLWCDANPSSHPKCRLKQCSRCRVVWACSNDCMKRAWKAFHKKNCIEKESMLEQSTVMVNHAHMGAYDKYAFEKYGVFIVELNGESHAAATDENLDEWGAVQYFESLSNRDVWAGDAEAIKEVLNRLPINRIIGSLE